ncbi:ATP-binding cassette domain-containing protein [Frigidibacter mobilis]|uniref:Thiamine ABC transporter ATP-binding protein n=1 Tax=Frigidibacter mobilis TaxID=1335048 RepID=A0A161H299_9RHOB|nr:ATP-binding cassette domain-containing protein [Frigidibacter mobilis]AMY71463.1 thiamine ABC transporter ATP-binding protein [Frigidibacter mobilis]
MLVFERARIVQGDFTMEADFAVPEGARVAVIGPSGAGKSTLLAAVAGFVPLTGGRILWAGQDLAPLAPGARPLSILFQDQNLFPHLTVLQNVGLGLRPDLRLARAQQAQVAAALERVGLAGLGARLPAQLSGGQQGRVALARALLRARPLLLLDEPFAALGPALKAEMLDLVAEIAAETASTVLMVSHEPADARRFAPLSVLVAEGRASPPRPTAALLDSPPPALAAYLGK